MSIRSVCMYFGYECSIQMGYSSCPTLYKIFGDLLMMKRLVVLVICALVVGCGGGSSSGKMAMDSLEEARRAPMEKPVSEKTRRLSAQLPGNLLFMGNPFENYMIERGELKHPTDDQVKHTDGFIEIPGWTGARYTRYSPIQFSTDTFVIYTNSDSPSDTDYVDFGYWRSNVLADSNDPTSLRYDLDRFVLGPTFSTSQNMQLVEGSATYSGPATGFYGKKSGSIFTKFGEFKANTTLSVEFGVPNPDPLLAKDLLVTISGSVTDFTDINGDVIDSTWTVDLQEAQHSPFDDDTGEFDPGMTAVGGTEAGKWDYQYFGPLDGTATARPTVVGGGFDAEFPNGKVGGAFAATLD